MPRKAAAVAPAVGEAEPADERRYLVRALERGIDVLLVLNQFNGLSIADLTAKLDLPRPTVFRLLKTLAEEGYVVRSPADNRYRLTPKVRELSDGWRPDSWISAIAQPIVQRLAKEAVWPLAIATLCEGRVLVELSTDNDCRLLVTRSAAGTSVPFLWSSAGYVFLAFSDAETRAALLARAFDTETSTIKNHALDVDKVNARIAETAAQGFAFLPSRSMTSMAVPLYQHGKVIAAFGLRYYMTGAVPEDQKAEFIALLKRGAAEMNAALAK
jgi:IclR family mhp operon transcriptional activator